MCYKNKCATEQLIKQMVEEAEDGDRGCSWSLVMKMKIEYDKQVCKDGFSHDEEDDSMVIKAQQRFGR